MIAVTVMSVGLLGVEPEGGGHAATGAYQLCDGGAVTGEVQGGIDTVWLDASDGCGEVAAVVDAVVGAEPSDQGSSVLGGGGGDDGGAQGPQELDGDGAYTAGRPGYQHGVAGARLDGVDGVGRGGASQAKRPGDG